MPSPATRAASRQLGRGLRRLLRGDGAGGSTWPTPGGWSRGPRRTTRWCSARRWPSAAAARTLAAGPPRSGRARSPASAAVRLLGLDPYAVQGVLAGLAPAINAVGAAQAAGDLADFAGLPAPGRPRWTCWPTSTPGGGASVCVLSRHAAAASRRTMTSTLMTTRRTSRGPGRGRCRASGSAGRSAAARPPWSPRCAGRWARADDRGGDQRHLHDRGRRLPAPGGRAARRPDPRGADRGLPAHRDPR